MRIALLVLNAFCLLLCGLGMVSIQVGMINAVAFIVLSHSRD
jgi:hypothetical protein